MNKPSDDFREIAEFTWDEQRSKAAIALASGKTHKEAAEDAECSDRTIRNWLQIQEFAEEVDRLSLMVNVASRAERLRLAMRVISQKTNGSTIETKADLLDWLKFAQSETDGAKLDLMGHAAKYAYQPTPQPEADPPMASERPS